MSWSNQINIYREFFPSLDSLLNIVDGLRLTEILFLFLAWTSINQDEKSEMWMTETVLLCNIVIFFKYFEFVLIRCVTWRAV